MCVSDLGGVHGKQVLLCGFVSGTVGTDAVSQHQHEVLSAASERHQVFVGM